jgi:hypothetical protein
LHGCPTTLNPQGIYNVGPDSAKVRTGAKRLTLGTRTELFLISLAGLLPCFDVIIDIY